MKFSSLNITVVMFTFWLGIGSVWAVGGFSFLVSVFENNNPVPDGVAEIEARAIERLETKDTNETVSATFPFKDYPVTELYAGRNAKLSLTKEEKSIYGKKLQTVENEKVNFGGHYIAATWSCGMWCYWNAIINARTGNIFGWNGILAPCFPELDKDFLCNPEFSNVEYKVDSSLIVFFGCL